MSEKQKKQGFTVKLDNSQFVSLVNAIEKLAKAVAVAQIGDNQSTEQKARFLRVFGVKGNEIADILGITEGRVSQILGVKKKKGPQGGLNDGAVGET